MSAFDNFTIRIHDANDELVTLTMFQLLQWIYALRIEIHTGMKLAQGRGRKTSTIIKEFLSCRKDYPVKDLLEHLETSKENIEAQLQKAADPRKREAMRKHEAARLAEQINAISAAGGAIPHEYTVKLHELTQIIAEAEA